MSRPQERTSYQPPPRRKQYSILFLGNAGTGKASMRNRIIYNEMQQHMTYDPTLEDSHRKSMTIDSEECIVDIMETDSAQAAQGFEEMCGNNDHGNLIYPYSSNMQC
ncbi:hypothetical protein DID88_004540 [Monilinia fructigena]|uniref:Uncharacterized protein n=1 Tax=Monilinia fructigena TaxID=38457 RepID=A0A395IQX0_9HELO|nr:hypothetical protein DID88_004540 [Monilinia fructigena]